jgi:hypothetical protein
MRIGFRTLDTAYDYPTIDSSTIGKETLRLWPGNGTKGIYFR